MYCVCKDVYVWGFRDVCVCKGVCICEDVYWLRKSRGRWWAAGMGSMTLGEPFDVYLAVCLTVCLRLSVSLHLTTVRWLTLASAR